MWENEEFCKQIAELYILRKTLSLVHSSADTFCIVSCSKCISRRSAFLKPERGRNGLDWTVYYSSSSLLVLFVGLFVSQIRTTRCAKSQNFKFELHSNNLGETINHWPGGGGGEEGKEQKQRGCREELIIPVLKISLAWHRKNQNSFCGINLSFVC